MNSGGAQIVLMRSNGVQPLHAFSVCLSPVSSAAGHWPKPLVLPYQQMEAGHPRGTHRQHPNPLQVSHQPHTAQAIRENRAFIKW